MGVSIINLESNQRITVNESEPLVLGRGDITGCMDKRVSRRHGKLTDMGEGKVMLMALHTNPCFVMKGGLPPITQIKKNEEETLADGDYIALLPDTLWFQVQIKSSKEIDDGGNGKSPSSVEQVGTSENLETEPCPSTSGSVNSLKTPTKPGAHCPVSPESTPLRETCIGNASPLTRRLPCWMYDIDEPAPATGAATPNKRLISPPKTDQTKKFKTEEATSNIELHCGAVKTTEDKCDKDNAEPESTAVTSECDNREEKEVKTEVKKENPQEGTSKAKDKSGYESDVMDVEESEGSRNSSSNPIAGQRRPLCPYEGNCYRKNPQHKSDMSHPGDPDYVSMENRPMCEYGAACYRQNTQHRVEFQHPTDTPAPHPAAAPPPQPARAPRPVRINNQDDDDVDEDEYDLEDPFVNDGSSDDYSPSDSEEDSDLSQSQTLSQEEVESLKRLKKEAKRFVRGGRNK